MRRSDSPTPLADEIRRREPGFSGGEGERFRCPLPEHGGDPDGDAVYHAAGFHGLEYESFYCFVCSKPGGVSAFLGLPKSQRPRPAHRMVVERRPELVDRLGPRRQLVQRSVDLLRFRLRTDSAADDEGVAELRVRLGADRDDDQGEADEAIGFLAAEGLVGLLPKDADHYACGFRLLFPISGMVAAENDGERSSEGITTYSIRRVVADATPCAGCLRTLAAGRDLRFRFDVGPLGTAPVYGPGIRRAVQAAAGGDLYVTEGAFDSLTALAARLTLGVLGLPSNGSRTQFQALALAIREAQAKSAAPARVVLLAQSDEAFQANVRHAAEHLGRVLPVLVTTREVPAVLGPREKWDLSDLARVVGPAEAVRLLLETAAPVEPPPTTPDQIPRGARPAQPDDVTLVVDGQTVDLVSGYQEPIMEAVRTVLDGRSVFLLGRPESGKTTTAITEAARELVRRDTRARPLDSGLYSAETFDLVREKFEAFRPQLEEAGFVVEMMSGRSPDPARPGFCAEFEQRSASANMDARDPCIGCPSRSGCGSEPSEGERGGFLWNAERVRRLLGRSHRRNGEARRAFFFVTTDYLREHAELFRGIRIAIVDEDALRRLLARPVEIDARHVGDAELPRFLDPSSVPRYSSAADRDRDLLVAEQLVEEDRSARLLGRRKQSRQRTEEPLSFPTGLAFEVFAAAVDLLQIVERGEEGVVTGRAKRRFMPPDLAQARLATLPKVVRDALEFDLVVPPYEERVTEGKAGARSRWVSPPRWDFERIEGVAGPAVGRRLVSIARDVLRGRALAVFEPGDGRRQAARPSQYVVWSEARGARSLFERGRVLALGVTAPSVPELYVALKADRRQLWHDVPNLRTSIVLGRSFSQTNADARADIAAHAEAFRAKAEAEGRVSVALVSKSTRVGPLADVACDRAELGHFGRDEKATNRFQDAGATEIHVASWTAHVSEAETFAAWVAVLAGRPLPDFTTRREFVRAETTGGLAPFAVQVGAKNGAGGVPVDPLYRACWLSEFINTRGNALGRTRPGRDPDREHRAFLYGGTPVPGFPISEVHDVASFADRHGVDLRRVRLGQDASVLARDRAEIGERAQRRGEALGALLRGEVEPAATSSELCSRFGLRGSEAKEVRSAFVRYLSTTQQVANFGPADVRLLLEDTYSKRNPYICGATLPDDQLSRAFSVVESALGRVDDDGSGVLSDRALLRELDRFGLALPVVGPHVLQLDDRESKVVTISTGGRTRATLAALRAGTLVEWPSDPRSRKAVAKLVRLIILRAAAVEAGLVESVAEWKPENPVSVAEAIDAVNAARAARSSVTASSRPDSESARNRSSDEAAPVEPIQAFGFRRDQHPPNVHEFEPAYVPPRVLQDASAMAALGLSLAWREADALDLFRLPTENDLACAVATDDATSEQVQHRSHEGDET